MVIAPPINAHDATSINKVLSDTILSVIPKKMFKKPSPKKEICASRIIRRRNVEYPPNQSS